MEVGGGNSRKRHKGSPELCKKQLKEYTAKMLYKSDHLTLEQ